MELWIEHVGPHPPGSAKALEAVRSWFEALFTEGLRKSDPNTRVFLDNFLRLS